MRAAVVLFALVATPFVVGVAQGKDPFSDPKNCGVHLSFSDRAGTRRADAALPHGGKHGVMDRPCASETVPPTPAPACAVTALPTVGLSIDGRVLDATSPVWVGIPNWCVQLSGPVNAIAQTDASGRYIFTGLPDGTYTVCEVVPSGWAVDVSLGTQCQTFPLWGFSASFVYFWNTSTSTP